MLLAAADRGGAGGRADAGRRRGARGGQPWGSAMTAISALPAPPRPLVRSQVATINIRRRSLYSNLARAQGRQPAGSGDHRRLPAARAGRAWARPIMLADGKWRRRAPGQPAPVPDYCR